MSPLTDRYISAVIRLLPESQRAEVARELEELIGELTDAHRAAGPADGHVTDGERAERAALVELGDPNLLAARYVERPRALVGPELFPEYVRTLKVVGAIVVPILTALAILGAAFDEDPSANNLIEAPLWAAYQGALQVAFWVTLVYAFAHRWKGTTVWSPDDLEAATDWRAGLSGGPRFSIGDIVFGMVVTVLAGVALVWQHAAPFLHQDGVGVAVLHTDIWNGAGQALLVLLAASLALLVAVLGRRRWTYPLAAANAAVNAASLGIVGWLAFTDKLINPAALDLITERAELAEPLTANPWLIVVVIGAIELWDSIDAFRQARRGSPELAIASAPEQRRTADV